MNRGPSNRTAAARYQHRFDRLPVGQPPEILPGAVGRLLDDLGLETGQGVLPVQRLPELQRQLGRRSPVLDRGNPQSPHHLLDPVAGQPALGGPGRETLASGAGREIEKAIAGHP